MKYRLADVHPIDYTTINSRHLCAVFFCVAVVEWMDLLALGRPKWPHGHRLAAIGKGSGNWG